MSITDERKPDGGLQAWIEALEDYPVDAEEVELLMLLIELRRRRENDSRQPGGKGNM